ncbi:TPA: alpha-galactosidase, partial [Klebsiella pneumoniae]|nr:alpha-galactosidase [Klebsiella pneumoniae]
LSLSPGPAHLRDGAFLQQNANMWRLTDDFWDEWPMILDMFERCNSWSPFIRPGNWPDCDMLPLGRIAIRSDERGLSERDTRLSKDEQQTMMTLWSIFQSPLMFGGDMTQLDEWTLSLLNNEEINAMHLKLINQKQVYRDNTWVIWEAMSPHDSYVAVFNISDTVAVLPEELKNEYLPASDYLELWRGKDKSVLKETVNPHASYIFRALSKN